MDLALKGKVALVTGSTAGIGLAIAETLAREGAAVIVNGRSEARVAAAVEQVGRYGTARGVAADVTRTEGLAAVLEKVPEVDILVNNFGIYEAKTLPEIEDDDWQRLFTTNVVTGALLAQRYLPRMLKRGTGRIIFIASETGVNVPPDMIPYGVSKAAQIALARGLAETTAGTAVTVTSVLPGPTRSEGIEKFLATLPLDGRTDRAEVEGEFLQKLRPTSLLKRLATAEEVAAVVAFLASPQAAAINGAAIRAEGGLLRGIL